MYVFSASPLPAKNIPFFASHVAAGFPSPADGYIESQLDLNSYLVSNPNSTFFARLDISTSLTGGIRKGSVLIVDRSINPSNNKIIIAIINQRFLLRRLKLNFGKYILVTDNPKDKPITLDENSYIWGVVTSIITRLQ